MNATRTWLTLAAAGGLLLAVAACEDSETIAPDGATITLAANPAQVILAGTPPVQVTDVTILATVRNSIGVPLPGQDVRFTNTNGRLTPQAGIPISTDDLGNAICVLSGATGGPQITATSGKATANITLTAASGEIATILLSPSPLNLSDCDETFTLTATALDSSGDPIEGVLIFFEFTDPGSTTGVTGSFTPASRATDTLGEAVTDLTISNASCEARCRDGKDCSNFVRARDLGGNIRSLDVKIEDGITP